jgi:hypothetical protein
LAVPAGAKRTSLELRRRIAVVVAGLATLLELEAQDHLFALELRQQGDELGEGGLFATGAGAWLRRSAPASARHPICACVDVAFSSLEAASTWVGRPRQTHPAVFCTPSTLVMVSADGCAEANLEATTVADVRGIGRGEGGACRPARRTSGSVVSMRMSLLGLCAASAMIAAHWLFTGDAESVITICFLL